MRCRFFSHIDEFGHHMLVAEDRRLQIVSLVPSRIDKFNRLLERNNFMGVPLPSLVFVVERYRLPGYSPAKNLPGTTQKLFLTGL